MIKHIFCDLDGTLYHNGIDGEDILQISNIQKQGITFNIATGRTFLHALNILDGNVDIKGYYICENGSYIYNKEKEEIFRGTIDDEIVKKVITRFESEKAKMYFKYNGSIVLSNKCDAIKKYTNDYVIDEGFIHRKHFDNLIGNIGIVCDDVDELGKIELDLKCEFDEILDIYFSSEHTLNLTPKNVSKRKGIEFVCNILGINKNEIATIGDSPNDINMLKGIEYSFAMENARDSVKQHANYVVKNVSEAIQIIKNINN